MCNIGLFIPTIISIVFLIIGLPTYLMGCNDTLYPLGCVGYFKSVGIVQSTYVSQSICQKCVLVGKNNVCTAYTCYNAIIQFDVCKYDIGSYTSQSDAKSAVSYYQVGNKYILYRLKSTPDQCSTNSKMVTTDLPITGVFFLTLFCIIIIINLVGILIFKLTT
jgi:hypothetical protein